MELNYEKTLLTVNEAALLTGINPGTVHGWVKNGKIKAKKELIDGKYTLLLDHNEVLKLLKTFKGKIHTKDEIEQMICGTQERSRKAWKRYSQVGPISDKKWNIDKPVLEMNENKEKMKERNKKYYSENRENIKERTSEYFRKYYSENKENIKEQQKKYREKKKRARNK